MNFERATLSVRQKTLTLAITFLPLEICLSYLACVMLMARPFQRYHEFWTCDLERPSKNFNIGNNFFTLRDMSFIFSMCNPYGKTFPTVPWILNVRPWAWPLTYFWKNFNIGHNFFIIRERAFILGMCVPYDKTFPPEPWILNMWPWLWPLAYFWKTLTLAITFLSFEIKLSYLALFSLFSFRFRFFSFLLVFSVSQFTGTRNNHGENLL